MSLIKLNLEETVKSTSSAAATTFFKSIDKKGLFAMLTADGMPSDIGSANDILDFRFINIMNSTARFGVVVADEDEDAGFAILEVGFQIEPEINDDQEFYSTLADAKKALKAMR